MDATCTVSEVTSLLREWAPLDLAEAWDNVGLLVGDPAAPLSRGLTCLTLTSDVADEAIALQAGLVVTHHPVLFKPTQRITAGDPQGKMLLRLIAAGVAVYSAHTAYDTADTGVNQQLAQQFGLQGIQSLRLPTEAGPGAGRFGSLPVPQQLVDLLSVTRKVLQVSSLNYVGNPLQLITRIGIACGAAAEFIPDAIRHGCEALLTGEARFHDCLRAREQGLALILPGHYATERPAVETLAQRLAEQFPQMIWAASSVEQDPVGWA